MSIPSISNISLTSIRYTDVLVGGKGGTPGNVENDDKKIQDTQNSHEIPT